MTVFMLFSFSPLRAGGFGRGGGLMGNVYIRVLDQDSFECRFSI